MESFSQMNSLDSNKPWKDGILLDVDVDCMSFFSCIASVCCFLMLIICKRCTKNIPFHSIFN